MSRSEGILRWLLDDCGPGRGSPLRGRTARKVLAAHPDREARRKVDRGLDALRRLRCEGYFLPDPEAWCRTLADAMDACEAALDAGGAGPEWAGAIDLERWRDDLHLLAAEGPAVWLGQTS